MNTPIVAARRVVALLSVTVITTLMQAADVRVYVRFAPGQKAAAQAALEQARGRVHHEFDHLGAIAVSVPEDALDALQRNPVVTLIEEDPERYLSEEVVPYGITMVNAPAAWQWEFENFIFPNDITVGVIDTGVFKDHEDLQGVVITGEPGQDLGPNHEYSWYRDFDSHGTHVVGTIAANSNSVGVIGVSPGRVGIHMVKMFGDTNNRIFSSTVLAAAQLCAARGASVINMSLGNSIFSTTENDGFTALYEAGVLLVAAAGNSRHEGNLLQYPAGYASVISVSSIDKDKLPDLTSQGNDDVEFCAPGEAVLSTVSFVDQSAIQVASAVFRASKILFSFHGASMPGGLVYGTSGPEINPAWRNAIVLLDRDDSPDQFAQVLNVQASGGLGCIIANNVPGNFPGTLGYREPPTSTSPGVRNSSTIPAVSVSQELGTALKGLLGTPTYPTTVYSIRYDNLSAYALKSGTSMAAPHVSGVAALLRSDFPTATPAQVRLALAISAEDLGVEVGRDSVFGHGLVNARAALIELGWIVRSGRDTTPPVISGLNAQQINGHNVEITWTTNEPARSAVDVQIPQLGKKKSKALPRYENAALTDVHRFIIKGTKGDTYSILVTSTDAVGNAASSAVATTITID